MLLATLTRTLPAELRERVGQVGKEVVGTQARLLMWLLSPGVRCLWQLLCPGVNAEGVRHQRHASNQPCLHNRIMRIGSIELSPGPFGTDVLSGLYTVRYTGLFFINNTLAIVPPTPNPTPSPPLLFPFPRYCSLAIRDIRSPGGHCTIIWAEDHGI